MTTKNNEINFFDIINIIKRDYFKIFVLSLLILIVPSIYLYKNHTKDLFTLKLNYGSILKSSNNLRIANNSINELYHNQIFLGLKYKLEMFYTEFVNSEMTKEVLLRPSNQDKINFIDENYIIKSLKKSQFIRTNEISVQMKTIEGQIVKSKIFDYSVSFLKSIKGEELKNIDKIISDLSKNINKILIDEIILTIEDASVQFQVAKNDLIDSLKKSNELISDSYIYDLRNKVDELKNKLVIVEFIESEENLGKFSEYLKSYDYNNATNISSNEFINLAIPGSGVIKKQIEQLENKINFPLVNLPQVYYNNQLMQLVESEFLKNQIINDNKFPYNKSEIFYLTDFEINNESLSFNLAFTYFSFFIIFSLILSIIFYIILDIIRKYN